MTDYKIQSMADLEAEMRAVASGKRAAPEDAARPSVESADVLVRLLTPENRELLRTIRDRRPESVADPARMTSRAEPNLLRTLAKLEAAGLVTRARSARDERAVDIALTDAGTALRERALRVPGEVVERLGYSVDRLERLRDELTSLLDAAHAAK